MKSVLLSFLILINSLLTYGQIPSGLIAHWDMNGTTNDVSGNGLNGNGNNLSPAAGKDGVMGHGWYFNGVDSRITIPYAPALNVQGYTISATIKVMGFYTGSCHGNTIFNRGTTVNSSGIYYLVFSDYPAGYGCSTAMDTSQESFIANACGSSALLGPSSYTPFNDTPHIVTNKWYHVVATFNDTVFKIYVNDTLRTTVASPTPGVPMGVSMDSASIGYCIYDAPFGYPYPFKGIIDDIGLWNRALSECEISKLFHGTSSLITQQPSNDSSAPAGIATFSITDVGNAATYQWQVNTGTGFVNLSNMAPYSGVTTKSLTVSPVTTAMNNYSYRCIRNGGGSCIDTSSSALLVIETTGISDNEIRDRIVIAPNPVKRGIAIESPVVIRRVQVLNVLGQTVVMQTHNSNNLTFDMQNLPQGIYILRINDIYTKKFIKED